MRESPAMEIVKQIRSLDIGKVMACDPNVTSGKTDFPIYPLKDVLDQADIIVLLVDHAEFIDIDPIFLKDKVVFDTKGIFR